DAPAQLMQLRQPEPIRVLDDDDGGVRYVYADLDDRRGDQHIQFVRLEARHHRVFFVRLHLAVQQPDPVLRKDFVGDMLAQLGRALGLKLLALLDQRADDIYLTALVEKALRG